jgi:Leucine-rich repeat (LRR) protein
MCVCGCVCVYVGVCDGAVPQFNALTSVPELSAVTALCYLNLSHNAIASVAGEGPGSLAALPHLTSLNLSNNKLTDVEGLQRYVRACVRSCIVLHSSTATHIASVLPARWCASASYLTPYALLPCGRRCPAAV